MITLRLETGPILNALGRLETLLTPEGMKKPLIQIGEYLAESTRQRFVTSTGPDGKKWVPNSQATYLLFLGNRKSETIASGENAGRINQRGAARAANKRPLVATGNLAGSIGWQLTAKGVAIGTNWGDWKGGAAVHQFGTARAGRNHKVTIPARPFLGLSAQDEVAVQGIIDRAFQEALGS
ncbi:MAG: phage virion morphogenesis protein [Azoarcus sp.]|jgi:phage gpG-like protein|nr:phage virion morphogenesis protein [Azoarcus sp.]